MATKQVQSFQEYFESLKVIEQTFFSSGLSVITGGIRANGSSYYGRITLGSLFDTYVNDCGVLTKFNSTEFLDGKYVAISEEAMGNCINGIDTISSNGYWNNGVCFPQGINFGSCEKEKSWIGWDYIDAMSYGLATDSPQVEGNVCNGYWKFGTTFIDDLYVNNLHTSDSSGGSLTKDNADIRVLVTDVIEPKDSCGLVHINGGISFDSDVAGIFKYDLDTSHYSFDNGLYIGGDSSISFDSGSSQSPDAKIYFGEGDCFVTNRGIWIQPYHGQQYGYLYAGNCDKAEVFNAGGTLTKIYSQTEIDDKIKALEARIAALESK